MPPVDPKVWAGDALPKTVKTRTDRLRHAMAIRGVRTNELDRMAGVGSGWTSKFLADQKPNPGARTMLAVCRALGIRQTWLLEGTGEMDMGAADIGMHVGASESHIRTPAPGRRHPDIEATVRIHRNRRQWSEAALLLADEIARARQVEPDEVAVLLDRIEAQIEAVKKSFLR